MQPFKKKRITSYRTVITASFFAINIIVVLALLIFNFRYTYNLTVKNVGGNISSNLDVAAQTIQSDIASYQSMVQFIAWNPQVIEAMTRDMENYPVRDFSDIQRLYTISTSMMANLPIDLPLHLINYNNNISLFSTTNYYAPYYKTSKHDFFQRIDQNGGNSVIAQPHWRVDGEDSRDVCYSLGSLIVNEGQPVGYVVLDVYEYYFQQVIDQVRAQLPELESVLIIDDKGVVLTDSSKQLRTGSQYGNIDFIRDLQDNGISVEAGHGEYLLYCGKNGSSPIYIVGLLSQDYYWKTSLFSMKVFLPLAALTMLLGVILSIWFSSIVAGPINKLSKAFGKMNSGNLSVRVDFAADNTEIGLLGQNFNDMASSLESLIEEDYKKSLLLQQAELNVLKSQINPHFLYNCMNMVTMTARLGKVNETAQIANALSSFYRYIMKDHDKEVSLSEEIEQISNYLAIYQIRFSDRLTVEMDIHPQTRQCTIMKMLLQPIVENAMVHGIEQVTGAAVLSISTWEEDGDLFIQVRNNGPEKSRSRHGTGIGMDNVRRRIALYYGKKYGISMKREQALTVVTIRIEARRFNDE